MRAPFRFSDDDDDDDNYDDDTGLSHLQPMQALTKSK